LAEHGPDEQQPYDRWSRPRALSTRGYLLAVLVPLLVAAAAFGVISLVSSGGGGGGTAVRVPTSDWIPGQAGGTTLIEGEMTSDARHCVYLETADGQQEWPVWPAGFTGRVDAGDRVSVYDGADRLVARDGQQLRATGRVGDAGQYTGEPCVPQDGRVVVVQSGVSAE
jgi:hypothetical protein